MLAALRLRLPGVTTLISGEELTQMYAYSFGAGHVLIRNSGLGPSLSGHMRCRKIDPGNVLSLANSNMYRDLLHRNRSMLCPRKTRSGHHRMPAQPS